MTLTRMIFLARKMVNSVWCCLYCDKIHVLNACKSTVHVKHSMNMVSDEETILISQGESTYMYTDAGELAGYRYIF